MNRSIIGALVVLVILIGAAAYMNLNSDDQNNQVTNQQAQTNNNDTQVDNSNDTVPADDFDEEEAQGTVENHNISITTTGFNPSALTIRKGDTVTFTNNTGIGAWPASGPHPTHTNYPEFDPLSAIAVGQSWTFQFDRIGEWGFHDHLKPSVFGRITVTE